MRRALLALATGMMAMNVGAQVAPGQAREISTRLLDHLDRGEFAAAEAMFDEALRAAVPKDTLAAVWQSLPGATARGETELSREDATQVLRTPLHRAGTTFVATIAVDADGRVSGLLVRPVAAEVAPPPPIPADADYAEMETQVGEGAAALPATLALPRGTGPFPAVVLVHGSGAHDRDETIGPNRPFLDIARGLAAQGIAVLRYEKRTRAHPQEFVGKVFGVDEETTHDAVRAVAALRASDGIDPERVFVLGHSQGGMLAPRIAAMSGHVAGLVLLAAPARSLLDIVIEQNRRLAVLDDGAMSDAERAAIAALTSQVRAVRDPATEARAASLMGQPVGYWRSVDAVEPVAEARKLALPMLVLQGARDIQVVDADWQLWRRAFHADPKVAFKLYDALNHLGIAGEGEGSLAEYQVPGHVDAALIGDIAAWIKAR